MNDELHPAMFLGEFLRWQQIDESETELVEVEALNVSNTVRLHGEDRNHVLALTQVADSLPHIIVHRPSMSVIDGVHRVRAARLRGVKTISALFFNGSEADAFALGVYANVRHGLPLSLADRISAAKRILALPQTWSDSIIAAICGLSPKTVGNIRRRSGIALPGAYRVGRDGRARPLSTAHGRLIASELLTVEPQMPLRDVAKASGISVGTARDVRVRLERHDDPVPARLAKRQNNMATEGSHGTAPRTPRQPTPERDWLEELQGLARDPSLRFAESGRRMLRVLDAHAVMVRQGEEFLDNIPTHCTSRMAVVARGLASIWENAASRLEQRAVELD